MTSEKDFSSLSHLIDEQKKAREEYEKAWSSKRDADMRCNVASHRLDDASKALYREFRALTGEDEAL